MPPDSSDFGKEVATSRRLRQGDKSDRRSKSVLTVLSRPPSWQPAVGSSRSERPRRSGSSPSLAPPPRQAGRQRQLRLDEAAIVGRQFQERIGVADNPARPALVAYACRFASRPFFPALKARNICSRRRDSAITALGVAVVFLLNTSRIPDRVCRNVVRTRQVWSRSERCATRGTQARSWASGGRAGAPEIHRVEPPTRREAGFGSRLLAERRRSDGSAQPDERLVARTRSYQYMSIQRLLNNRFRCRVQR